MNISMFNKFFLVLFICSIIASCDNVNFRYIADPEAVKNIPDLPKKYSRKRD